MNSGNLLEMEISSQKWIGAVELKCARSHRGVVKAPVDLWNTQKVPM